MTQAASLAQGFDTGESPAPDAAPDDAVVESPQDNDDDPEYIRIPRSELFPTLGRLVDEDPEFGQAARTIFGSRQKREYETAIDQLKAEKAALEYQIHSARFEAIEQDQERLAERLQTDPQFRQDYAKFKGSQPPPAPDSQATAYKNAVLDQLDQLEMVGLHDRAEAMMTAIQNGTFSRDANGRPLSLPQQLTALTTAVERELVKARQPKQEAPQGNPKLQTGNPDTQRSSRGGSGGRVDLAKMTQNEIAALQSTPEGMAAFESALTSMK